MSANKIHTPASKNVIISSNNPQNIAKRVPFAVVEAYKTIRTNILFLIAQNNGKVISLSSADAGEGKSTTSINLAVSFAQLNKKVLLVDADMRRSSIHKKLKLSNENGLSNLLAGFASLEETTFKYTDYLDIITAGPIPPNPSELLSSAAFESFVEAVKEKYDYVFIDTPPINIVSDTLVLAPKTDGLILLVRNGYTPHDEFEEALASAKMANINVMGAIMNGTNPDESRYFKYKYKYRYRYRYGRYGRYGKAGKYKSYNYGKKVSPNYEYKKYD